MLITKKKEGEGEEEGGGGRRGRANQRLHPCCVSIVFTNKRSINFKRKGLFWLTVLELSVQDRLIGSIALGPVVSYHIMAEECRVKKTAHFTDWKQKRGRRAWGPFQGPLLMT
jgi:hypothetical protein